MTADERAEQIFTRLHYRAGICNHCGKRRCAGKHSGSHLPTKLNTEDVLWAINYNNVYGESPAADSSHLEK